MLAEIEDNLIKLIQEKLIEVPEENIAIGARPNELPAIVISNLNFKFNNDSMAENLNQGNVEVEETINSDGTKNSYKLREKPLRKSLRVESPPGIFLSEKDYATNYADGSIKLRKASPQGMSKIFVRYNSQRKIMTLKSLKVKALYTIDVLSINRTQADSLAEKIVKALLTVDNQIFGEGVEIKPIEGITSTEEGGKTVKVQLKYVVETEIRVEQVVGPIEKIEITSKNI